MVPSASLVVAPTEGTGKTVVEALDYQRLRAEHGDLRLLFVAHREQILRQFRRTFREALGDGAFGELLVGGHRPSDGRHVFASIQTRSSPQTRGLVSNTFDVVVVDEFDHAEAATYRRLLDETTAQPPKADERGEFPQWFPQCRCACRPVRQHGEKPPD